MINRRSGLLVAGAIVCGGVMFPAPAGAVIHEIVAAYCSGGGHGAIAATGELEPPGLVDMTKKNFARPVLANGAVDIGTFTITDHPAAKFPAGTSVFAARVDVTEPDHPSAHCAALSP